MADETIIAYYDGVEVMILLENSFLNKNGTQIAAIEKIDNCSLDGRLIPKHVAVDNLAFLNGQKQKAIKLFKKNFIKQKKQKSKKNKTIKKTVATMH